MESTSQSKGTSQISLRNPAFKQLHANSRTIESDFKGMSAKYGAGHLKHTPKSPQVAKKADDYTSTTEEEEGFEQRSGNGNNDYEFLRDSSEKKYNLDLERNQNSAGKYKKVRMQDSLPRTNFMKEEELKSHKQSFKTINNTTKGKRFISPPWKQSHKHEENRVPNQNLEEKRTRKASESAPRQKATKSTIVSSTSSEASPEARKEAKRTMSRGRSKSYSKMKAQKEASGKRKGSLSDPKKKTKKKKEDESLAQRLLLDIVEKYKNVNGQQNSCYINKLEKKTMINEINMLVKALIKNEKRYAKAVTKEKSKYKELKKVLKIQYDEQNEADSQVSQLQQAVRQFKQNEEHLLQDLLKQQKIAKDSLKALESLSDKYDREKREMIVRMEREKEEQLRREEGRHQMKVQSLKQLNEQLNSKLGVLSGTEEDFHHLQKNYNEAIQIIDDQKQELQQQKSDSDDLRLRNSQLEDELKDIQAMLGQQQKIYQSHISELRVQINELEEATKSKYEEQLVQCQMELKHKGEQMQRLAAEKQDLERRVRAKMEEAGVSNTKVMQELEKKEQEAEKVKQELHELQFEVEKLKRLVQTKDEEVECERSRFSQKYERKCQELEKERGEWHEVYSSQQKELSHLKNLLQEKENHLMQQHQSTLRKSVEVAHSYRSNNSPQSSKVIYVESGNNQVTELQEQLKTKEEEIKILWNVIKEINRSKGSEKISVDQLKAFIQGKASYSSASHNY